MKNGMAVSQSQIDDQLNTAIENIDRGHTRFPGMTYEEGVQNALEWVTGQRPDAPMED